MEKRVTSEDVAKRAGVSRSVVSAVLNGTKGIRVGDTKRQAVLDAIRELGYRADAQARGMRTGRSRCIGAYGSLENPLFLQVLQGAQRVCMESGYQLLLYGRSGAPGEREELLALYRERRIDGLITKDRSGHVDEDWVGRVMTHGLPFVSVEGYPDQDHVHSVLVDYKESVHLALDYLWSRTGLAPVYAKVTDGRDGLGLHWGDRLRLQAYLEWVSARGIGPVVHEIREPADGGEDVWSCLLEDLQGPAAILCNWFRGAHGLYRSAERYGFRIGKDLFIMSADNTVQAAGYLVPTLAAMEIPYAAMGAAAAERVIRLIETGPSEGGPSERSDSGPSEEGSSSMPGPMKVKLSARLLEGESVGMPTP
jgi:LacI family transcriptional regulator